MKLLVGLFFVALSAAHAQTTFASITGVVSDGSGAVIAGAEVTATNIETNIATRSTSNESGNYTIPQLREGTYIVRVQAAGFKQFEARDVVLVSRDLRRVDATLEVGSVDTRRRCVSIGEVQSRA